MKQTRGFTVIEIVGWICHSKSTEVKISISDSFLSQKFLKDSCKPDCRVLGIFYHKVFST